MRSPCSISLDLSYAELGDVQDGNQASEAFRELMSESLDEGRRQALRNAPIEYCKLDTLALVHLARFLEGRAA